MRSTVDIVEVMDRLISGLQQARAAGDESCADGFLDRATNIFCAVREWCVTKLAENGGNGPSNANTGLGVEQNGIPLNMFFMEDFWLKEGFTFQSMDVNMP